MTTLVPGALIVKEGRALAPIWLGAVVTVVAGANAGMGAAATGGSGVTAAGSAASGCGA